MMHLDDFLNDLYHPDLTTRLAAIQALGELGDARAIDALLEVQTDSESAVQVAATQALVKLVKDRLRNLETLIEEMYILDMPEED